MTWKSRIAALLLALCCLTAALTGCGQSAAGTQDDADSKKVVIYTPTEDYLIEYMQQRLTAQFPDYDISLEYYHSGDLAAKLQAEGARMCICSNTWSAQCRTVLTRLGIDEYFDFYVEAQGALHKSRPDVFFQTLTLLGGTDPDRCVVCEDSLYAARTAHDAGFHVIGIADAASKSDEPALREVSDQFLTDWTELDWDKV